jgi:hypothetical protein
MLVSAVTPTPSHEADPRLPAIGHHDPLDHDPLLRWAPVPRQRIRNLNRPPGQALGQTQRAATMLCREPAGQREFAHRRLRQTLKHGGEPGLDLIARIKLARIPRRLGDVAVRGQDQHQGASALRLRQVCQDFQGLILGHR